MSKMKVQQITYLPYSQQHVIGSYTKPDKTPAIVNLPYSYQHVNFPHLCQTNFEKISDIHGSVHRKCIFKYNQQDAKLHNVFISVKCEMLYLQAAGEA
jgi:hypothetical protein